MGNITVGRYADANSVGYAGWMEPEDRSWGEVMERRPGDDRASLPIAARHHRIVDSPDQRKHG